MGINIEITSVPESARVDLERFAKIVIGKWEFNVVKFNLISSGDLLRSFQYTVSGEANGDGAIISFVFEYYLRMLEMGVGKGSQIGKPTTRKRYPVFTKTFNAEVHRLAELLANQYATEGALSVFRNV
ncbi:MAG: hypothetical protein GWP19_00785 [Planctomycetia bacterium]|nr:hypothetical protein [Planctomycetia bacterium]